MYIYIDTHVKAKKCINHSLSAFEYGFEYGSSFMRLLKHVESGQNDIFPLQLIKLHYFDKF